MPTQVILRQDVDKVGLRGEVVSVARGYARNFLLPRKLAETATPAQGRGAASKREAQRARHEAQTVEQARRSRAAREDGAPLRRQGRPHRRAVRLGHGDGHRRRALAHEEDPRRPAQDRPARPDQADRPLSDRRSTSSRTSRPRCGRWSSPRAASCRRRRSSRRPRRPRRRRPRKPPPRRSRPPPRPRRRWPRSSRRRRAEVQGEVEKPRLAGSGRRGRADADRGDRRLATSSPQVLRTSVDACGIAH